jgi:nitrogen regulatory protein P-II 1
MKLIIAIVQPHKIDEIKRQLNQIEVTRLTIMDCLGFGRQQGKTDLLGADEVEMNLRRKIQLQIAVNEEFVEPTIEAIVASAKSGADGTIGDGKIFVVPLDDCIRVRTGERGPDAV